MPRAELETRRSYKHLPQSRAGEHESTQNGRQSEAVQRPKPDGQHKKAQHITTVSYTHLTLPTICSV